MSRRSSTTAETDWMVITLYLALVLIGWMMIYAVGFKPSRADIFDLSTRHGSQLLWIIGALIVGGGVLIVESKFYRTFAYIIYGVSLFFLIGVLVSGTIVAGSKSWLDLGFFRFQPAEVAKFSTCLALASFMSSYNVSLQRNRSRLIALAIIFTPMILILLQGDAGSALVFSALLIVLFREGMPAGLYVFGGTIAFLAIIAMIFPTEPILLGIALTGLGILFLGFKNRSNLFIYFGLVAGAIFAYEYEFIWPTIIGAGAVYLITLVLRWRQEKKKQLLSLLTAGMIVSAGFTFSVNYFFNKILKPHQQDRINVWLNPSKCDPLGALYNVTWSKLAIGSGGFSGKGYLEGTITKLNYVPEQETDFIFCTVGEEQGFLGAFAIILLYLLLMFRIIIVAERQRARFTRIYAYGVVSILFFHFFINIGMTMGIMPVIGIPLPLISYGGSSLIAFTILIAILVKLDADRLSTFR